MEILKYILEVLFLINCVWLVVLVMKQNKDDRGASGTIVGSSTNNFYEKNKSRTREGRLKKWTIISGCMFLIYTIAIGIIAVM